MGIPEISLFPQFEDIEKGKGISVICQQYGVLILSASMCDEDFNMLCSLTVGLEDVFLVLPTSFIVLMTNSDIKLIRAA